jgi:hypothetical protein
MDLMRTIILCYALFLIAAGYIIPFMRQRKLARISAWVIAVVTLFISALGTSDESPLSRMFIIAFLLLLSMKIIVAEETYSGENRLKVAQWIAFSLGWFGMRPRLFENLPSVSLPFVKLVFKAVSRIFIGLVLLYLSTMAEKDPVLVTFFIPQFILLVGLSLILHFGILNLSTAAWRYAGVDVPELFRSPYLSKSLKEFWGRRWNVAFSEMTALIVYRPLKSKIGLENALVLSFLFSGLLHEIAISLPVRTGYGFPMLYFVIHAAAMHAEARSSAVQKIIRHPVLARVWVMIFLVLPMPLLFHNHFIHKILIPLRDVILGNTVFHC